MTLLAFPAHCIHAREEHLSPLSSQGSFLNNLLDKGSQTLPSPAKTRRFLNPFSSSQPPWQLCLLPCFLERSRFPPLQSAKQIACRFEKWNSHPRGKPLPTPRATSESSPHTPCSQKLPVTNANTMHGNAEDKTVNAVFPKRHQLILFFPPSLRTTQWHPSKNKGREANCPI